MAGPENGMEGTKRPNSEKSPSADVFEGKALSELRDYIPEENRPTLEISTWIEGATKAERAAITDRIREAVIRAEGGFQEPKSKAGKALELELAAFVVKNDDEGGGFHWGGRKSNAVLAHEGQDYLGGMTDLILFLHGAEESYAPSQVAVRIDANTGYTSLIKKLCRSLNLLREMGTMGNLPFTTFRLGGGLDVQAGNLENAPLTIVSFNEKTVRELATLFDAESSWEVLKTRPEQIMMLEQIELQLDAYRQYLLDHLAQFKKEWAGKRRELGVKLQLLTENTNRLKKDEKEIGRLRYQLFILRRALDRATIEKTFRTMIQVANAAHERRLERIATLYTEELKTYRLQIAHEVRALRTVHTDTKDVPITANELAALQRVEEWLARHKDARNIPLQEIDALYRAAHKRAIVAWKSILDAAPPDDLHMQTLAALRDPALMNRIAELSLDEFKSREENGNKVMGEGVREIQAILRKNIGTAHPLVAFADLDEALEKFPFHDEKDAKAYTLTSVASQNIAAVETAPKVDKTEREKLIAEIVALLEEQEELDRQITEIEAGAKK